MRPYRIIVAAPKVALVTSNSDAEVNMQHTDCDLSRATAQDGGFLLAVECETQKG